MEKKRSIHPYYTIIAIVLSISVVYVSLLPKQELPEVSIFQIDKLVHISMYFLLTCIYHFAFFKGVTSKINKLVVPALIAFGLGTFVEFLQHFATNSRFFDVFDILANTIGIIFAIILLKKLSLTS